MAKKNPTLNPALRSFWQAPARNRILLGGRSSSKSWDAAGFAIFLASNYQVKFLCARKFQNKIEESVYSLLKIQIDRFGLQDDFLILKNKIVHKATKSEFIFYGLWRHIEEIKSLEGVDICWIEEAHALTKNEWDILQPTIRKEGSQFWVIFNPRYETDFVYKKFIKNTPANTLIRKINYDENPFLSSTMLELIENLKNEDYDEYLHIYKGMPKENDDEALIKRKWIDAALDAHKKLKLKPLGEKRIGFDVADDGPDKNAIIYSHGFICSQSKEWKGGPDEILESSKKAFLYAQQLGASVTYDCIGVGASVGSKFNELNKHLGKHEKIKHYKFNAGSGVLDPEKLVEHNIKNKDMFANLKAQAWWSVAMRFKNTYNAIHKGQRFNEENLISIDSEIENINQLIEELTTPKKALDNLGRIQVESKKDLKKRGVDSPNLADAFIMSFAPKKESGSFGNDFIPEKSAFHLDDW